MLAFVALYDELWSGVAVVAAPEVEAAHGVGHAAYTLWVFAVPLLLASLIEVPLALWSDRARRQQVLRGGLLGLGGALLLCAAADRPWLLSLGLALAGAASGVACQAAEAELVATHPGGSARAMSRWVTLGAVGDAIVPLVVGGALWIGGSYRLAMVVVAGVVVVHAATVRMAPRPPAAEDEEARESWRTLLARPRLWLLLLGATMCLLLDEVVVAIVALRMARDLDAGPAAITACLTAASLGAVAGAAATEWILARVSPRTWLVATAVASVAALALVVAATTPWVMGVGLVLLGAAAAAHYPLLQAAAYDLVPSRPGLVNAASQVFVGFEVGLPLAIGVIAASGGTAVALVALAVQPVFVIAVAVGVLGRR